MSKPAERDLPELPPVDPQMALGNEHIRYVCGFPESYVKRYAEAYARAALASSPAVPRPAPSLTDEQEREAFEKVAMGSLNLPINRDVDGEYVWYDTHDSWMAWKARAALAAPLAQPEPSKEPS